MISSLVQSFLGPAALTAFSNTEGFRPICGVTCWVCGLTGVSRTVLKGRTNCCVRVEFSAKPIGLTRILCAILKFPDVSGRGTRGDSQQVPLGQLEPGPSTGRTVVHVPQSACASLVASLTRGKYPCLARPCLSARPRH